jgi:hypothetical protein
MDHEKYITIKSDSDLFFNKLEKDEKV